jgi:DsrE/DsrF/DsrH-like protein
MARLLFLVMGAPFESELTTSLLRLIDEALRQGHDVRVWACGGATTLTRGALGPRKGRNVLDPAAPAPPSTLALVEALALPAQGADHAAGRLDWCVCRPCLDERAADDQSPAVRVQPAYKFVEYLQAADVVLSLGVK